MADVMTGHEFLMKLKENGDKSYQSFDTLYTHLDRKARREGIPLNGQFELTPLCNFDCKMCYTHLTKEQMQGKPLLSIVQWKQIVDEAYAAGMIRVNLTGGECLTYPGFDELYLYLHSMGCEIRVLTNGALLDDRWISFFEAHPPIMFQISLYGGDEDTYEQVTGQRKFSVVYDNIRKLMDTELPVALALTPNKYMGKGLLNTVRVAHELGVPFAMAPYLADPYESTGRSGINHELTPDEYVELFRYRDKLRGIENPSIDPDKLPTPGGPHHDRGRCGLNCGGGLSCFNIAWDGTMSLCTESRDVRLKPLEDGFMNCWKKIHEIAASWPCPPECKECPYEEACTNCEILKAEIAGEAGKQPLALCERTQYLVQHGVYTIPACQ